MTGILKCLKGTVPENTVKGGTPSLSRINEAGQDDEVIVGEEELTITGRYRLVVATRCGLGGEYRVVEASREVEVK